MFKCIILAVFILLQNGLSATAGESEKLVFEGKVESIDISPLPNSMLNFVVTMRVNRVLKGHFANKNFQFRIHSPSLSEPDCRRYVYRRGAAHGRRLYGG